METFACFYIVRGEPFRPGTCLNLTAEETVVGRASAANSPDVAFTNTFISRNHFVIRKEQHQAVLYDSGSRHGTEINGVKAVPHTPYPLVTGDMIKLAKGLTVIQFSYSFGDQTLELEPIRLTEPGDVHAAQPSVDWEKRECVIDGKRTAMSEKEYLFLQLLQDHSGRLVTIPIIKQTVWPDRNPGLDGSPDVSMDELNALIYRIRKKFGRDTFPIRAVRGSGYIMDNHST